MQLSEKLPQLRNIGVPQSCNRNCVKFNQKGQTWKNSFLELRFELLMHFCTWISKYLIDNEGHKDGLLSHFERIVYVKMVTGQKH